MNRIIIYALVAGVTLGTGCSKKDKNDSTEVTDAKKVKNGSLEELAPVTEESGTTKKTAVTVPAGSKESTVTISALEVPMATVVDQVNMPIKGIRQKADDLDANELMGYVVTYKATILEKKSQFEGLKEQLKGLSMQEVLGDRGKELKHQLAKASKDLNALKERYKIYLGKLEAMGVDISTLILQP